MTSRSRKAIQARIDSLLQVGCHADPDSWLLGDERLRAERRARAVEAQALKRQLPRLSMPCRECGRDVRDETYFHTAAGMVCFGCGINQRCG